MGMLNAKHRHVCDKCLTITKEIGDCPKCGHSELRPFMFFLQSGGKYHVVNTNSVKQETA